MCAFGHQGGRHLASEQVRMIADPAPLGLAAFALTTFLQLGKRRHHAQGHRAGGVWRGPGLRRLCPTTRRDVGVPQRANVFGATMFSSYGAFWLSFWAYLT